jgi:hypothetical protein
LLAFAHATHLQVGTQLSKLGLQRVRRAGGLLSTRRSHAMLFAGCF